MMLLSKRQEDLSSGIVRYGLLYERMDGLDDPISPLQMTSRPYIVKK
ncbi:hypothetical protein Mpsy_0655 [Methanolobus psychrophilus R15]|nr:hypothetical protein Mpsy_0655 [Methanolobus psychrophilus R15]